MRFGQNYATQATESRIDLMPLGLEIMETTTKTGPVAACLMIDLRCTGSDVSATISSAPKLNQVLSETKLPNGKQER